MLVALSRGFPVINPGCVQIGLSRPLGQLLYLWATSDLSLDVVPSALRSMLLY